MCAGRHARLFSIIDDVLRHSILQQLTQSTNAVCHSVLVNVANIIIITCYLSVADNTPAVAMCCIWISTVFCKLLIQTDSEPNTSRKV